MTTQIIILICLLFFSAFFSGIETALMSVSRVKVNSLVKKKKKGSKALYRLKQNPQKLIITILIGNNVVNVGASALATVVFTDLFGSSGVGIATGIMTFLILVFGEISPKTLATENAVPISLFVSKPLEILSKLLSPFVWFFSKISGFVTKLFGSSSEQKLSEAELKTIVTMGKEEGILTKEAADMMHNVLTFKGTKVTSVMTPQIRIKLVDGNKKLKDVLDFMIKSEYSKYPIYIDDDDNIIGMIDIDDVLEYVKDKKVNHKVKTLSKDVLFVPESKEIDDLLKDFEKQKKDMAIVVDEYSKLKGIVTLEDILEEIVGDIFDKSQRESVYIKRTKKGLLNIDTKISVQKINQILHLGLKEGHFNTLSGYIENYFKKIPKKGDEIVLKKVKIIVDKVTKKGIKKVKIVKK